MSDEAIEDPPTPTEAWDPAKITSAPPRDAAPYVWVVNTTKGYRAIPYQQTKGRNHVNELQVDVHKLILHPGINRVGKARWEFFAAQANAQRWIADEDLVTVDPTKAGPKTMGSYIAATGDDATLQALLAVVKKDRVVDLVRRQREAVKKLRKGKLPAAS